MEKQNMSNRCIKWKRVKTLQKDHLSRNSKQLSKIKWVKKREIKWAEECRGALQTKEWWGDAVNSQFREIS